MSNRTLIGLVLIVVGALAVFGGNTIFTYSPDFGSTLMLVGAVAVIVAIGMFLGAKRGKPTG